MIPTIAYHGAHTPTVEAKSMRQWEGERCAAFVHDIMSRPTYPASYSQCDVMLTDLPWQKGYDVFNERAGITDGRTYAQFMARVAELVEAGTLPLYLVTGRHALPKLPRPGAVLSMRLNEDDAVAIGYRVGDEVERSYGDSRELLHALAARYHCAGDWCCGYGRTGRFFLRASKRAVLSDYNPTCIGYIAEHAPSWALDVPATPGEHDRESD